MVRIIKPDVVGHIDIKKSGTSASSSDQATHSSSSSSDSKKIIRHAIYSIDIQPGGNRFATGGGDSSVRLWSLPSLLSTKPDEAEEALLCSISNHTKSVNIVRWSQCGQLLASGSDDTSVLIYRHTPGGVSTQSYGTQAVINKEVWNRCYTLHGHTMDVLDLDFSPRNILASASIDNRILLWDIGAATSVMSPFRVLRQHASFVKGLSFDPIGKYLSSCGTDNLILMWDCDTWECVATLSEPMKSTTDRSMFRRMSWAPDGASLCVSAASKAAKPIGVVLRRSSWEPTADLVGHEAQSTCCRFCPNVLTAVDNPKRVTCAVALADQAGVLSIWSTARTAPLLVLRECFEEAVTDITWDREGRGIMACCSLDGTITILLDLGLGVPMKEDQLDKHFCSLYGRGAKDVLVQQVPLAGNSLTLRYAQVTAAAAAAAATTAATAAASASVAVSGSSSSSLAQGGRALPVPAAEPGSAASCATSSQTVSTTKDGRKRISPMQLSNDAASSGSASFGRHSPGDGTDTAHAGPSTTARTESQGLPNPKRPRTITDAAGSVLKVTLNRNDVSVTLPMYPKSRTLEALVKPSRGQKAPVESLDMFRENISVLHATHLIPPKEIAACIAMPYASSCMTSITLLSSSPQSGGASTPSAVWKSVVTGQATCLVGLHAADSSDGLCVTGCSDGTLHILSLQSGTRLSPPLVLGPAVVSVDIRNTATPGMQILALTADGEIVVWEVEKASKQLLCKMKTNVKSVLLSVKTRINMDSFATSDGTEDLVTATVDKCYFYPSTGCPTVHVKTLRGTGVGGDWQVFSYMTAAQTWVRVADLRYVLSDACRHVMDHESLLDSLQRQALAASGITTQAVAALSRGLARPAGILEAPSGAVPLQQWLEVITSSHAEERISLAGSVLGSHRDLVNWLSQWTTLCCKSGEHAKVRWLVNQLISEGCGRYDSDSGSDRGLVLKLLKGSPQHSYDFIKDCVLPAVAADSASEGLLTELHEAMEYVLRPV